MLGPNPGSRSPGLGLLLLCLLVSTVAAQEAQAPDSTPLPSAANDSLTASFEDLLIYDFKTVITGNQRVFDLEVSFLEPGSEILLLDGEILRVDESYRLDHELGRLELMGDWPGARLELRAWRRPVALPRLLALQPLRSWRELSAQDALVDPEPGSSQAAGPSPRWGQTPSSMNLGGSKSIVLRMGSGEDVALEQSLRLNLQGRLGDSTHVEAVLRDDDLPFQAQGNTERLEELDKVFLRVSGPAGRAQVGDFVFAARDRELTPFQRDFQGIEGVLEGEDLGASLWLARSRGVFRSEEFYGVDGLQGPYELLSALRDDGAVILAGSEEVQVNGQRLTRGRDRDYVVDYDLGTLTFMVRRPVSAGDLIRVDFRFSQENWRRGAWGAGLHGRLGPVALDFFHFDERDNPDNPLAFSLDEERREVLQAAGDDLDQAITSGVIEAPGEGRYVLSYDNPDCPGEVPIYVWVDSLGDYNLQFHQVTEGTGSYRTVGVSATGERIFAHQCGGGDFELGQKLQGPEGYRLESLRLDWATDRVGARAEIALSGWDPNLLSTRDDGDNDGLGLRAELDGVLGAPGGRDLKLSLDLERRDLEFRYPGRRRGAEDYRRWNLPLQPGAADESAATATLTWGDAQKAGAALRGETLRFGDSFDGLRGGVKLAAGRDGYRLRSSFEATASDDSLNGDGHREILNLETESPWPILRGLGFDLERVGVARPDSLDDKRAPEQRGNYERLGAQLRLGSRSTRLPWTLRWREERISADEDDRQRSIDAGVQSPAPAGGRINLAGHYQRREGFLSTEQFLAESRMTWLPKPGSWGGEGLYRLGSRRQRLRQTQLVYVGLGQGDLNEEGVFVGEGEGDYRRLFILGDEAVQTRELELEARLLREEAREGSFWRRLGSETRLSLREETRDDDLWGLALLKPSRFQEPGQTLLGSIELRQELRYRPAKSGLDLRYRFRHLDRLDARDAQGQLDEIEREQTLRLRRTATRGNLQMELRSERRLRRDLVGLGSGSYDVSGYSGELSGTRHLSSRFSVSLRGGFGRKKDVDRDLDLRETLLDPSLALSPWRSLRLNADWEFTHSAYAAGDPGAARPWFFEAPGWKKVLRLEATAQAGSNLTLSAHYELREESDRPRRHRLRMESRAFF